MFKEFWNGVRQGPVMKTLQAKSNELIPGMLAITTESDESHTEVTIMLGMTSDELESVEGFDMYHFPASEWMIVEVIGRPSKAMSKAWDAIYSDELELDGYLIDEEIPAFEAYIDTKFTVEDSVNQIWVPVKKTLN